MYFYSGLAETQLDVMFAAVSLYFLCFRSCYFPIFFWLMIDLHNFRAASLPSGPSCPPTHTAARRRCVGAGPALGALRRATAALSAVAADGDGAQGPLWRRGS